MSEKYLTDKLALVTGASRGLGKAIAVRLAELGATVIGTATSELGAKKITECFAEHGLQGKGIILNVAEQDSVDHMFTVLKADYRLPDILVNSAGITRDNLLLRMKDDEWFDVINTNLNGVYRVTKPVIKAMMKQRWGRIINISSVSGITGLPGQTNYSA